MTFDEWRTLVKTAYQGGEPTHASLIRSVVDGARSVTVRDVESDLALARSYQNSFRDAKVKLAGTRITDDLADVIAEAKALMPIDDDTERIVAILENAIEGALDEINGIADKFEAFLLQAAIDLQRHVPFYQVRQITTFLVDTAGVTNEGFISRVALPETARIQQLWYGHYYAALEADVDYEADDIVISNGRAYKVVTGGTLTAYEVAEGLASTDGSDEELGDLVFRYYSPERDWPVRQIDWNRRNQLRAGDVGAGPMYAFPPQSDELWLYPVLDSEHRFDLEWVGVTEEFEDDDEVTFDRTAAEAAAHYIRAMLFQTELDDGKQAATSLALYQRAIRKAVVDNQARDTGSPPSVAPYDYRRRWRFCGACGVTTENSNNGTEVNPNAWAEVANTGGDSTLTPTAANMTFDLTLSGAAGLRRLVLATHGQTAGNRVTVRCTFPETAGLIIDFRNGALAGDQLLPALNFPDQTFTTDGVTTSGTFEFVFGNNTWEYVESSIPA